MYDCGHYPDKFMKSLKALHCPIRWEIIGFLGEDKKATGEIFEALGGPEGRISRPSLYYHLSELEGAGIVEVAEYREAGGGAPEKVWKLKTKEIKINLLKGDERR